MFTVFSKRPARRQLPADILFLIAQQATITTLLSLRLISRSLNSIISTHITSLAPIVARNTFQDSAPLLLRPPTDGKYSLKWLTSLIPMYLASVLVDRHRFRNMTSPDQAGVAASDEAGEVIRSRIVNGLCVLKHLSNISQEIYSLSPAALTLLERRSLEEWETPPKKKVLPVPWCAFQYRISRSKRAAETVRRERLIWTTRLTFLRSLSRLATVEYRLTTQLLHSAFITNHRPSPHTVTNPGGTRPCCGLDSDFFDWGNRDTRRLGAGNSWANWAMLHYGPQLFWRQWCGAEAYPGSTVRERLLAVWAERKYAQVCVERAAAWEVEKRVHAVVAVGELNFPELGPWRFNPLYGIEGYFERWRGVRFEEKNPPRETLEHVSFFVDMRGEVPAGYSS